MCEFVTCKCGDYHKGDEDHHKVGQRCPRVATKEFGLCDECYEGEVE